MKSITSSLWSIFNKQKSLLAAFMIGALSLVGGVALASVPDSNGAITGCYGSLAGYLRIIDTANTQNCGVTEKKITWSAGSSGQNQPNTVLARDVRINQGTLVEGTNTPVPILNTQYFGMLEATNCGSNGEISYQLHNTSQNPVVLNYDYSNPLQPGDSIRINGSPTLITGTGSTFKIGSTNFFPSTYNGQCIFTAQVIVNTQVTN